MAFLVGGCLTVLAQEETEETSVPSEESAAPAGDNNTEEQQNTEPKKDAATRRAEEKARRKAEKLKAKMEKERLKEQREAAKSEKSHRRGKIRGEGKRGRREKSVRDLFNIRNQKYTVLMRTDEAMENTRKRLSRTTEGNRSRNSREDAEQQRIAKKNQAGCGTTVQAVEKNKTTRKN